MKILMQTIVLFLLAASLSGCRTQYSWHQKLTIVVETPRGARSGTSVVGIDVLYGQLPGMAGNTESLVTGEATIVNLGRGKYLFALLLAEEDGGLSGTIRLSEYTWKDQLTQTGEKKLSQTAKLRGTRDVPREQYPLLVTFDNINDPESVKQVNPDNLANNFGPGFVLKSIKLEITDEPVTTGSVEKLLPWINTVKGRIKPTNKKYARDVLPIEILTPKNFRSYK